VGLNFEQPCTAGFFEKLNLWVALRKWNVMSYGTEVVCMTHRGTLQKWYTIHSTTLLGGKMPKCKAGHHQVKETWRRTWLTHWTQWLWNRCESEPLMISCYLVLSHLNLRYAWHSHRFMNAYKKGLSGKLAAWATKKYCGHWVLPNSVLAELKIAGIWHFRLLLLTVIHYIISDTSDLLLHTLSDGIVYMILLSTDVTLHSTHLAATT
jgi:hypothetical protein